MKRKFLFLPLAALVLSMVSCGGNGNGKLPEVKNETDSLSYYLGSVFSIGYWQLYQSNPDMARDKNSSEEFYKGVASVLDSYKPGNVSYNEGVRAGMQIVSEFDNFKNDSEIDINKKVFLAALKNALRSQDAIDVENMQLSYRVLLDRIQSRTNAKLSAKAATNLVEYGKKHGMTQFNENLWVKVITPGTGNAIPAGQKVNMSLTILDDAGRVLMPETEAEVEMGNTGFDPSTPVAGVIETMKMGEKAEFATTAALALGEGMESARVKPDQVVIYKVAVSPLKPATSAKPEVEKK